MFFLNMPLLLQHLLIFGLLLEVFPQVLIEEQGCTEVEVIYKYKQVYQDWPASLTCNFFTEDPDVYAYFDVYNYNDEYYYDNSGEEEEEEGKKFLCQIIRSNGTVLLNRTVSQGEDLTEVEALVFPRAGVEASSHFRMKFTRLDSDDCWSIDLSLNVTDFHSSTCKDFLDTNIINYVESTVDSAKIVPCIPFSNVYPVLASNAATYTYEWQYNCSDTLPAGVKVSENNELIIRSVDFNQAGLYTCSVRHNQMTRYILFTEICVHHPVTFAQHVFTCSLNVVMNNENEDAVFECTGNFGEGQVKSSDINFSWKKKGDNNRTFCNDEEDTSKRKHCTYIVEEVCYLYNPADVDKEKLQAKVPVRFTIRNIQEDDYGEYIISATSNIEHSLNVNQSVILMRHEGPDPSLRIIIGSCIGAVVIILLLVFLALCNLVYLKVIYKIYFGKYELDNKDFGACLAYNYRVDSDQFDKTDVKSSVNTITEILQGMGYTVFDEKKEYCNGNKADCVKESFERSHRVIIFLTLQFIKDDWSIFQFYKGFDEMIQSGSKLIFIILPGMKEYLKQHQHDDLTCRAILSAIETNYSITWSEKRNAGQKRFRFEIEAAMPKLRARKASIASVASSYDSSSFNANGKWERSFSKETEVSEKEYGDGKC